MNVSRAAVLFVYECFRLLLLVVFLFIAPPLGSGALEGSAAIGTFFPSIVYISTNALFPLMVLFVWLKPEEYRNYLPLYIAGKLIGVVSFYLWMIFSSRDFPGMDNIARSLSLLGGSFVVNLLDILSIWGAWTLKNKIRRGV